MAGHAAEDKSGGLRIPWAVSPPVESFIQGCVELDPYRSRSHDARCSPQEVLLPKQGHVTLIPNVRDP